MPPMAERTQGIHELHGVAEDVEETPAILDTKLEEMNQATASYSKAHTAGAYQKASKMDEKYVGRIRLLCLRADPYNIEKAATRLASFFDFKQQLFGEEKLTKDITLDNFLGEDKHGLDSGPFQLLPERDRSGRAIIMFVGDKASNNSSETAVSTSLQQTFFF
jgi:hypothetical protein